MEKKGMLIPTLLAGLAASAFMAFLLSKEQQLNKDYETATILVASVDVPERTVLQPNMAEEVKVPRKFIQQDAIEIRTASDHKQILNYVTKTRIPKGNQITASALIAQSPESGLSVKVPTGYRGALLPIDSELKQLIKPGDRVDVLVTFDAMMNDGRKEKVTATILQNVLVIAVGTNLGQGLNAKQLKSLNAADDKAGSFAEKATVALALNPTEAQYLALSMLTGTTSVVLRSLGDSEMHSIEMASLRKLFH
jgi:pilus assembly protein CpaB